MPCYTQRFSRRRGNLKEAPLSVRRAQPYLLLSVLAWLLAALPGPVAAQADGMLVRVDMVKRVPLSQTAPVIGRLVARQSGMVAARIGGPIDSFQVEVGDQVEAGDVIAVLDADVLRAKRDLVAGRLSESQANLAVKEAQLQLARQEFSRMDGLKKSAAFNQARFDDARQSMAIAEAQVLEAEAAIASARADQEMAEISLRDAQVLAPYSGTIVQRMLEAGAYAQVGAPIVRMVGDRALEIEADVPVQHLSGITPDTEIAFALDDGTRHRAVVRAVVPAENPLTRTRVVRLVPTFGDIIRPLANEQSVTLDVPLGAERQILSVHKDAVIKRRGQDSVFVIEGDEAQSRPIDLGEAVGVRLEVRRGLNEGDRVVVRGNERLKPGDKVRVEGES